MNLSTAIRLGAAQSPQAFCSYQRVLRRKTGPVTATCALGAAYLGLMGRPRRLTDKPVIHELDAAFPALSEDWPQDAKLPCRCGSMAHQDGVSIKRVITHLNDAHRWQREAIADILDAGGIA